MAGPKVADAPAGAAPDDAAASQKAVSLLKLFTAPKKLFYPLSLLFQIWLYAVPILVPACLFAVGRGELVGVALVLSVFFASALNLSHHRYFSHGSFKCSRTTETCLAILGTACTVQRGPLWWASKHKEHHAFCDTPRDPMSRTHGGFLHAHSGWISVPINLKLRWKYVEAIAKRNPALVWVEATSLLIAQIPSLAALLGFGACGYAVVVLGQALSIHWEFATNSVSHGVSHDAVPTELRASSKATGCIALDNMLLGILSGGEGFHAHHHVDPLCARAGTKWYQLDLVYVAICALERLGVVWAVRHPKQIKPASQ